MSDLYERRRGYLDKLPEKYLEVQNFLDEKEHNLSLTFENNVPFQQEIMVELDLQVQYTDRKVI